MSCIVVVPMQNPMASSFWSIVGFVKLDEFQIIVGPPSLNAWKCGKFNNVGRVAHEKPILFTTTKGGWSSWWIAQEWYPWFRMSSTKHMGNLRMRWYAHWITSGGVRLVQIHQNQWACEPIKATSTNTSSSIQALICCQLAKIVGRESSNVGTFSNKCAHGCICVYCQHCTTQINSQNKLDLGFESPWPITIGERPWHDHLKMTKSIGLILIKSGAPNKVILFGR